MQYEVPVKLESMERRRKAGSIVHLLCGFYLLLSAVQLTRISRFDLFAFTALVALASIAYGFLGPKKDRQRKWNGGLRIVQAITLSVLPMAFFATAPGVQLFAYGAWFVVVVVIAISERRLFTEGRLVIEQEGLRLPGFFGAKQLHWTEVESFVLRSDYVTIFREGNTDLQLEVAALLPQFQRESINQYCREQIAAAKEKLPA